jgi:hypothetical protein
MCAIFCDVEGIASRYFSPDRGSRVVDCIDRRGTSRQARGLKRLLEFVLSSGDEIYADRIEAVRDAGLPIDIRLAQVAVTSTHRAGCARGGDAWRAEGSGGDRQGSVTDLIANAPTDPAALLFSLAEPRLFGCVRTLTFVSEARS